MTTRRRVIGALVGAMTCVCARAGDEMIFIIAHPDVQLAPEDVREVYLGERQIAARTKLVPLDNSALQSEFLGRALKLSSAKYQTLWARKGFRDGLSAPALLAGDAEVIQAVRRTPGTMGYVSRAPADVKLIQRLQ